METLQITKEAAVKAYDNAKGSVKKTLEDLFGKKTFAKNIRERINNFEDILQEAGMSSCNFQRKTEYLTDDEVAYIQLKLIYAAYNQGEIVDFSNDDQTKVVPVFTTDSPSGRGFAFDFSNFWYSGSFVGARLAFVGTDREENCKDAVTKFLDIFRRFHMLSEQEV